MSAHTKGEWRVSPVSWSETVIVADGFDHGICCLDINHATEESQEADGKVMAANARLIASSPDLFARLVSATDALDALTDRVDGTGFALTDEFHHALDEMRFGRAAIAKATEVQP